MSRKAYCGGVLFVTKEKEMLEYEVPSGTLAVPVGQIGGIVIEVVLSEEPRCLGAKKFLVGPAFKMTQKEALRHGITPATLRLFALGPDNRVKQEVFDTFLPGEERNTYFHLFGTDDEFASGGREGVHLSFELIQNFRP